MAQLVRAPPCHGGGRGFESHPGRSVQKKYRLYKPAGKLYNTYYIAYGILAQLGEHLPYKQRVIGSSPIGPISMRTRRNTFCEFSSLSRQSPTEHASMLDWLVARANHENAGVAELADAQDLKSCGTYLPYRFDSGRRHLPDKANK